MKVHPFCVILLTGVKMMSFCHCQVENNSSESYLIRQILMKNYDPLARPVANIYLNISMGLRNFIQLDMKKQTLVSFGWLAVDWYDQFLRWDLNQYPFYEVLLTPDMVWHPDLVVLNTVSDLDQLENQKSKVVVEHTGKVTWWPGGLFETLCSINILYYPFDTQTCTVEVSTWSSSDDNLKAASVDPNFESSYRPKDHPEWRLLSRTTVCTVQLGNYWVIEFTYVLERRVVFYVLNMIFPIILLSLMSCLVFLLPVDSGEKMTVSITVFLSFAVFLSVINYSLPPNSDSVCLFSLFVAMQMLMSVFSISTAAYVTYLHQKDQDSYTVCQCQPSNSFENMLTSEVSEIPHANTHPIVVLPSTTSTSPSFSQGFKNSESSQPSSEASKTVSGAKNGNCEGSVWERNAKLSIRQIWHMCMKAQHLRPYERRLLSRRLDKMCLKLVLCINIITCVVFGCIWIFAK